MRQAFWVMAAAVTIWVVSGFGVASQAQEADGQDEFIRGYASAVLASEFELPPECVHVRQAVVQLLCEPETDVQLRRMLTRLQSIPGVQGVVGPTGQAATGKAGEEPERVVFLPGDMLFKPLIADPRWPHFSASYQRYLEDEDLRHVGSATFGETFPFVRFTWAPQHAIDAGLQAAVFSIFDLASESSDLVNADYWVAATTALRLNGFSALGRLYHQSSHLGDEFLLRNEVERVNLSYEALEAILSQNLPLGLRVYGGGEFLVHREPEDLKRWAMQGGLEFRSPWTMANGTMRPVAGLDLKSSQENEWGADVSLRAGLQLEDQVFVSRKLQLLLEYYDGHSPNGQFYNRSIQYIGLGLHLQYD
ncbi:MAG: DUF1207 domain-containing protein [Desulfocurvibacter africanus]